MQGLVTSWLGASLPKQYCAFIGRRTLLQHTLDRARVLSPQERIVVVTVQSHRPYVEQTGCRGAGRILEQPGNRGTLVGLLCALRYVIERDPSATVAVMPSDHFAYPETPFVEQVSRACAFANEQPDRLFLLGASADEAVTEYGWISPQSPDWWSMHVYDQTPLSVAAFHEKPTQRVADALLESGAYWNTLVLAVNAATLWKLARRLVPDTTAAFEESRASVEEGTRLAGIYDRTPHEDISRDLLARSINAVGLIPLRGVLWSDWGSPDRIRKTLARIGRRARFDAGAERRIKMDTEPLSESEAVIMS